MSLTRISHSVNFFVLTDIFSNFFAECMRAQPELYEQLKGKTTKLGVNLGHCIKTGVDNKGQFFYFMETYGFMVILRSSNDQNRRNGRW